MSANYTAEVSALRAKAAACMAAAQALPASADPFNPTPAEFAAEVCRDALIAEAQKLEALAAEGEDSAAIEAGAVGDY